MKSVNFIFFCAKEIFCQKVLQFFSFFSTMGGIKNRMLACVGIESLCNFERRFPFDY